MHSIANMSARRHSMNRPAIDSSCAAAGRSARSVEIKWFPTIPSNCWNQNADIAVSTRPLFGTGSAITTSKALMRSDATMSSRPSAAS